MMQGPLCQAAHIKAEGGKRIRASLPLRHECPLLASGVLLSHGLSPQYHRRSGA